MGSAIKNIDTSDRTNFVYVRGCTRVAHGSMDLNVSGESNVIFVKRRRITDIVRSRQWRFNRFFQIQFNSLSNLTDCQMACTVGSDVLFCYLHLGAYSVDPVQIS